MSAGTPRHEPARHATLYVSGELPHRLRAWFEAHLLDCDDCWREVVVARLGRRLVQLAREPAPFRLWERIQLAIEADDDR